MTWTDAAAELEEMHEACRDVACPRCGSPVGARCVNPITKRVARVPCLARSRALDQISVEVRSPKSCELA